LRQRSSNAQRRGWSQRDPSALRMLLCTCMPDAARQSFSVRRCNVLATRSARRRCLSHRKRLMSREAWMLECGQPSAEHDRTCVASDVHSAAATRLSYRGGSQSAERFEQPDETSPCESGAGLILYMRLTADFGASEYSRAKDCTTRKSSVAMTGYFSEP
jgi:hypothetical protein